MKTDKEDNFEEYSLEDEEEKPTTLSLPQIWLKMTQAIIMPSSGWIQLHKSEIRPEKAVLYFLLPISFLASLSDFFTLLYEIDVKYTDLLVGIVITFFSFFLGYYVALLIAKLFLPVADKEFPHTNYGRILTIGCVGALALIHILDEALPMFDFIIEFFPLWIVFMLYKGLGLSNLHENKFSYCLGVLSVAIISSPFLIEWFFSLFSPIY